MTLWGKVSQHRRLGCIVAVVGEKKETAAASARSTQACTLRTYEARWVDAEAEVGGFTAVGFVKEGICSACVFQMTLGQSQDRSPAFAMLPAHKKNSVVQ